MAIRERFKNAWSAFLGRDPTPYNFISGGFSNVSTVKPDRLTLNRSNLKTIVSAVQNRIASDCALVNINHVQLNDKGNFKNVITDSSLNRVLSEDANLDQTGRAMIQDAVMSMLDDGCVAIVPVRCDDDPTEKGYYDIYELRVGKILQWYPQDVVVEVYNEDRGVKEQILMPKSMTAIIENPFYTIMNEPNSVAQRLIRVLNLLEQSNRSIGSNKLDLIVQMPYSTRSKIHEERAKQRRNEIEDQLINSPYGIAYTDGTEKIIQLNRAVENTFWQQARDLEEQLYNQLGFSKSILDGTADEATILNYHNSVLNPILTAITEEMQRKWLTRTAITQGKAIRFFNDPFKLIPMMQMAEIGDKFTRNEIMTSNELRAKLGMQPSDDPKADELRNANLNHPDEEGTTSTVIDEVVKHSVQTYVKQCLMHSGIKDNKS